MDFAYRSIRARGPRVQDAFAKINETNAGNLRGPALVITAAAGALSLICFVAGHYLLGAWMVLMLLACLFGMGAAEK